FSHIPGMLGATYSKNGLFSGSESSTTLKVEGFIAKNNSDPEAAFDQVGPNYFAGIGIPLLLGRDIGAQDTETSPKVAVINETMAKTYLAGLNPIGRKLNVYNQQVDIVGLARDVRDHDLKGPIRPRFYVSATQFPSPAPGVNFELR